MGGGTRGGQSGEGGGGGMRSGSAAPGAGGGGQEGGVGGAAQRGPVALRGMGGARAEWGVVWKLLPNKSLQPVRVKIGVTDFTFTHMIEGDLKVGDELVIGQSSANRATTTQQAAPGMQRGPMMGPGGMPRR